MIVQTVDQFFPVISSFFGLLISENHFSPGDRAKEVPESMEDVKERLWPS
jgi:hypothetical protein